MHECATLSGDESESMHYITGRREFAKSNIGLAKFCISKFQVSFSGGKGYTIPYCGDY